MNYANELLSLNGLRKGDKFHSYKESSLCVDGLKDKDKGDFDIDPSDREGIGEKDDSLTLMVLILLRRWTVISLVKPL